MRRAICSPDPRTAASSCYIGTGGPGHLDPRLNDGVREWSQGIAESAAWEAPLFRLFDDIVARRVRIAPRHLPQFGLLCRWSGIARAQLRGEKSSGMPTNVLTDDGAAHPWFERFAQQLEDGRHFRVVDNRLFDLVRRAPRRHDRSPSKTRAATA